MKNNVKFDRKAAVKSLSTGEIRSWMLKAQLRW